jgi:GDPmannose 4,6-dehydratase
MVMPSTRTVEQTRKVTSSYPETPTYLQVVSHDVAQQVRDWGYAPEYVEGMWRMLQVDEPDDFVLATGVGSTVRDFLRISFEHAGLNWEDHVEFDERYMRPTEVEALVGDASKAKDKLGWAAAMHPSQLARVMVDADIEALKHAGEPWIDDVVLPGWGA